MGKLWTVSKNGQLFPHHRLRRRHRRGNSEPFFETVRNFPTVRKLWTVSKKRSAISPLSRLNGIDPKFQLLRSLYNTVSGHELEEHRKCAARTLTNTKTEKIKIGIVYWNCIIHQAFMYGMWHTFLVERSSDDSSIVCLYTFFT